MSDLPVDIRKLRAEFPVADLNHPVMLTPSQYKDLVAMAAESGPGNDEAGAPPGDVKVFGLPVVVAEYLPEDHVPVVFGQLSPFDFIAPRRIVPARRPVPG